MDNQVTALLRRISDALGNNLGRPRDKTVTVGAASYDHDRDTATLSVELGGKAYAVTIAPARAKPAAQPEGPEPIVLKAAKRMQSEIKRHDPLMRMPYTDALYGLTEALETIARRQGETLE